MTAVVYIVDDDAAMRESLLALIEGAGFAARAFEDGNAFLAACKPEWRGCLVLDVKMPGLSGLAVQAELTKRGVRLPVIFLTGHGDVPMAVRAVKAGAVDFLEKPIEGKVLIARIGAALARDAALRHKPSDDAVLRARYASLTERERQVMSLAVAGKPNKDIARALGISHRTVEIHRARVMRKMDAHTLFELADMARVCESPGAVSNDAP
jgi:two-component system response regulator FixJ